MGMDNSGPNGNRRAISSRPALRFIGVFLLLQVAIVIGSPKSAPRSALNLKVLC